MDDGPRIACCRVCFHIQVLPDGAEAPVRCSRCGYACTTDAFWRHRCAGCGRRWADGSEELSRCPYCGSEEVGGQA